MTLTPYSRDTGPVTNRQPTTRLGWWRLLLAAIAAVVVVLLGAGTASAVTAPNLETRVGASTVPGQIAVGPHVCITAGQQWVNAPPQAETTVATGVAAKSGDGLIDASKVRFTQDSAGSTFSDGRSVLDLADDMARTGKAPEGLPQIRLFEQDGKLYSLDNRRLFAGQYAGVKLPYRMATPAEIAARNQTQIFDGTSIMIRFPGGRGNWAWWQQ